jgi:hypothetical protein
VNVLEDALVMAKTQERALRLRLHRIMMMSAGLEVKGSNEKRAGFSQSGDLEGLNDNFGKVPVKKGRGTGGHGPSWGGSSMM